MTGIDAGSIRDENAQDVLNVRFEDGKIRPRYGYEQRRAPISGHTASWGAEYLQGYSGTDPIEEYVTIENDGQAVRPFVRDWDGDNMQEITDAGVRQNLAVGKKADGGWKAAVFGGDSFWMNPEDRDGGNVYRHEIGNARSWSLLDVPSAPTADMVTKITLAGNSTSYPQYSFAGLDPTNAGDMAVTGLAQNASAFLDSTNQINLFHTALPTGSGTGAECTITIDLNECTAGVPDWSYYDILAFSFASPINSMLIAEDSIEVYLVNNDSSPVNISPASIQRATIPSAHSFQWVARADFTGKVRGDWDNIRKIVLKYRVVSTNATTSVNRLTIAKPVLGGVDMIKGRESRTQWDVMRLGYAHYDSSQKIRSAIGGVVEIPLANLKGSSPYTGLDGLGVWVTMTGTASSVYGVDTMEFYADASDGRWHRVSSAFETNTATLRHTNAELLALPEYAITSAAAISGIVCAAPFKGWMVWGARGGSTNIRHSYVGQPLRLRSDDDDLDDENNGADFTLADNYADEPQALHAVGNALVILGKNGAHAQIAPGKPFTASPPKRLPGSFGVANRFASAVWRDDGGNPGVVWLSGHGDGVYFATVREGFDGTTGFTVHEVTAPIRGKLRSFLLDGQKDLWSALSARTDDEKWAHARLGIDENRDALWIVMGKRAMVLRRPSVVDGRRYWEFYEYATGGATTTIAHLAFSSQRMLKWQRSNCSFDEVEFHQALDPIYRRRAVRSASYDSDRYIEGSFRDAGNRMPVGYWHSRDFDGRNRRPVICRVDKTDPEDQPTLRVYSTRGGESDELIFTRSWVRPGIKAEGWSLSFKIGIDELMDAITGFEWDEAPLGRRILA